LRGQRQQGGKVNTINKRIVGVQHMIARGSYPHASSHIIGRTDNAMTKIALTRAPTNLFECAVYIAARKKLIHAMSPDIDRPINRAVVVGCVIPATCNYLKLHMSRTLKVLLCARTGGLRPLFPIDCDRSFRLIATTHSG
jgi:hypothetical protein